MYWSHAEINYVIFGVSSTDYFLQLYQKADENAVSGLKEHKIEGISMFDIRGSLAHKTNSTGQNGIVQPDITEDIKKKSIEYLRSIL